MAKLTRQVLIRLPEDEYQKLKVDAHGFKSLSYYLRCLIKQRQPVDLYLRHMRKGELAKSVGADSRSIVIKRWSIERKGNLVRKRLKASKVGRNAPCPCGSGKKYKKCCLIKEL